MKLSEMKEGVTVKVIGLYAGSIREGGCFKIGDIIDIHYDEDEGEPWVYCAHGKHYLLSSLTRSKTMPEFQVVGYKNG